MKFLIVMAFLSCAGVSRAAPTIEPKPQVSLVGPIYDADMTPLIESIGQAKPDSEYTLYFNSSGGSVNTMTRVIQAMESAQHLGVLFICVAENAYSAAAIIYSVCDVRLAIPRARFMIHPVSNAVQGNADKLRDEADEIEVDSDAFFRQIVRILKIPFEELKRRTEKRDYWLDAGRALDIGLIQAILP